MINSSEVSHETQIRNRSFRMEIYLYLFVFICYTAIFYAIASIIHIKKFMGIGSLLCIYIVTSLLLLSLLYHKASMRYRALYLTLSWNQRITLEEVRNVLQRKHNINQEEILEFEEEKNDEYPCVICMEKYENREFVKLNCNHIFHTMCLAEWLSRNNNNCPTCRVTNIITRNDFDL